jgi:hypothetical protein
MPQSTTADPRHAIRSATDYIEPSAAPEDHPLAFPSAASAHTGMRAIVAAHDVSEDGATDAQQLAPWQDLLAVMYGGAFEERLLSRLVERVSTVSRQYLDTACADSRGGEPSR